MSGPDHSILVNDIYFMFGSLLDCSARATFLLKQKVSTNYSRGSASSSWVLYSNAKETLIKPSRTLDSASQSSILSNTVQRRLSR